MRITGVPGLEVTLGIDGAALQEYDDEGDEAPTASKYVEAISGANFAVRTRITRDFPYHSNDLLCYVYLDGKVTEGTVGPAREMAEHQISGRRRYLNGQWVQEPFAFADLETNDNEAKAHMKEALKDLGTVTVRFTRVREVYTYATPRNSHDFKAVGADGVPEKSLKGRAISSQATLGKPVPHKNVTTSHVDYPYGRDPFATFTFKYRSHRDLQIEGIIPRSPSPVPLEDRDPDDLSPEEARELVRRLREKQTQVKTEIKKEKPAATVIDSDDEDDDDDVIIESETRGGKRARTSQDSGVELIDLTEV